MIGRWAGVQVKSDPHTNHYHWSLSRSLEFRPTAISIPTITEWLPLRNTFVKSGSPVILFLPNIPIIVLFLLGRYPKLGPHPRQHHSQVLTPSLRAKQDQTSRWMKGFTLEMAQPTLERLFRKLIYNVEDALFRLKKVQTIQKFKTIKSLSPGGRGFRQWESCWTTEDSTSACTLSGANVKCHMSCHMLNVICLTSEDSTSACTLSGDPEDRWKLCQSWIMMLRIMMMMLLGGDTMRRWWWGRWEWQNHPKDHHLQSFLLSSSIIRC